MSYLQVSGRNVGIFCILGPLGLSLQATLAPAAVVLPACTTWLVGKVPSEPQLGPTLNLKPKPLTPIPY